MRPSSTPSADARRRTQPYPHGPGEPGARESACGAPIAALPDEVIDAFYGRRRPRLRLATAVSELRHLGGAVGRAGRERRRALTPRRRLRHVQRRDADDAGAGRGDPRATSPYIWRRRWPPGPGPAAWYFNFTERSCDVDVILPRRGLLAPRRSEAGLRPRQPHRGQSRRGPGPPARRRRPDRSWSWLSWAFSPPGRLPRSRFATAIPALTEAPPRLGDCFPRARFRIQRHPAGDQASRLPAISTVLAPWGLRRCDERHTSSSRRSPASARAGPRRRNRPPPRGDVDGDRGDRPHCARAPRSSSSARSQPSTFPTRPWC